MIFDLPNLLITGEVIPREAFRSGGATATSQRWSSEDQGDSRTGGRVAEVSCKEEYRTRSQECCC